ncbi:30S ribosomal protein S17 [Patescibacteria group bacterium]
MTDKPTKLKRTKKGVVVSKSGDKSVVVAVHTFKAHPKYQKRYRVTNKFHVHDPKNEAEVGAKVTIVETRPLSKLKHWRLAK